MALSLPADRRKQRFVSLFPEMVRRRKKPPAPDCCARPRSPPAARSTLLYSTVQSICGATSSGRRRKRAGKREGQGVSRVWGNEIAKRRKAISESRHQTSPKTLRRSHQNFANQSLHARSRRFIETPHQNQCNHEKQNTT